MPADPLPHCGSCMAQGTRSDAQGTQLPRGMDAGSVQAEELPVEEGGFGAPTFSSPQAAPVADIREWRGWLTC